MQIPVRSKRTTGGGDTVVTSGTQVLGLRERKKQRTRELIADTALELFLERGFDAVTLAEIAQRAEVDVKTIYNYFPSKPEIFYHRLEAWKDSLLDAVRDRRPGESVLTAFSRFLLASQGALADERATDRLRGLTRMILGSPALLAHEEMVYGRFTAALTDLLVAETGARTSDAEPSVVAHALIGLNRSLVAYVRAGTLAETPNAALSRGLRVQAKKGIVALEHGLGGYGIRAD